MRGLDLDREVVWAYRPAATCWLVAALAQGGLEQLAGEAAAGPMGQGLRASVVMALMAMLLQVGWVSWRLWRRRGSES